MSMTDVGRQSQHLLIDIDPLRLPAQNPADDKGMPQNMDAWRGVASAPRLIQPSCSRSCWKIRST